MRKGGGNYIALLSLYTILAKGQRSSPIQTIPNFSQLSSGPTEQNAVCPTSPSLTLQKLVLWPTLRPRRGEWVIL